MPFVARRIQPGVAGAVREAAISRDSESARFKLPEGSYPPRGARLGLLGYASIPIGDNI